MSSHTPPTGDTEDLFIVELDDRLEFGVTVFPSGLSPDVNTSCQNGAGCTTRNAPGSCATYYPCPT